MEKIPYIFILILYTFWYIAIDILSDEICSHQDTNPDAVYLCHGTGPK